MNWEKINAWVIAISGLVERVMLGIAAIPMMWLLVYYNDLYFADSSGFTQVCVLLFGAYLIMHYTFWAVRKRPVADSLQLLIQDMRNENYRMRR